MPPALPRWLAALAVAAGPPAVRGDQPPGPSGPPPVQAANVAATVNGEVIRLDEVDAVVRRLSAAAAAPLTAAQAHRLRREVADDLVDDLLVRQFLRQHAPKVEPAELDNHFKALAAGLSKQGRTLGDFLRQAGQTEAQARDTWAALVQFQKYVDAKATDPELRAYFDAHKDLFDGSRVRVSQIVARVAPNGPPGERAAARQKLAGVRADILAGRVGFADAARRHSVCPSAPAGGDLGLVGRRDPLLDEAVARVAFALPAGALSEPVDAPAGVHVVLVTERKPGAPAAFETVADLVRECYADDVRRQLVAHLRQQAAVQVAVP